MIELYNTYEDFTREFDLFLIKACPKMRKTERKMLPNFIMGMIDSESINLSDIACRLSKAYPNTKKESIETRLLRNLHNKNYKPHVTYETFISAVIKSYKVKHPDNKVHISIDHGLVKNKYITLMFTLRVGKQGVPIWFRTFYGKDFKLEELLDKNIKDYTKDDFNKAAYANDLLKEGIKFCADLFKDFNVKFLADRWFGTHFEIFEYINSLNCKYVFRTMRNTTTLIYDKKEGHKIWKTLEELDKYKYHSKTYNNISVTKNNYKIDLVISKTVKQKEAWLLFTNDNTENAVKDYGKRFGSIECVFKNQKSNGFYLETTGIKNLNAFRQLYCYLCIAITYLVCVGADYSKNKNGRSYNKDKIKDTKKLKDGTTRRDKSLFHTALELIHMAMYSPKYIKIPKRFILYDI